MRLPSKKFSLRNNIGLFYILPWIVGFLLFSLYPLVSSFYYSFSNYNLFSQPQFIGINNYIKAFNDRQVGISLKSTIIFTTIAVPAKLAFALFIAILLNSKLKLINLYRTVYYLPSILGGSVAIGVLWRFIFMKEGLLNTFLSYFNIPPVNWLGNTSTALYVLSLLPLWQFGSSMILFLASLKQIPKSLYESATIDGANKIKQFIHITIPMITPIILFNIIMQTINAFQEFSGAFIVTGGGPAKSTYLYSLLLYDQAFVYFNMGYASALSWILFAIIISLSLLIMKTSDKWVYYADGGDF